MLVTQVSVAGVLTRVPMKIRGGVVISTNPLLAGELPSGELPYAGYGAGALRISFGENWESGGTLRAGVGDPLWTFVEKATVTAGKATVIRDGVLPA